MLLYSFIYFRGGSNDNGDFRSEVSITAGLTLLGRAGWGLFGLMLLGLFVAYGRRSGREVLWTVPTGVERQPQAQEAPTLQEAVPGPHEQQGEEQIKPDQHSWRFCIDFSQALAPQTQTVLRPILFR